MLDALVDVHLADVAVEARRAHTREDVHEVGAGRAVGAEVRVTLVDVDVAEVPAPTRVAVAGEVEDPVDAGAVVARVRVALVVVGGAELTAEAR